MPTPEAIIFADGTLRLLDQTRLPHEIVYVECRELATVCDAIKRLVVRGAPAIGIAAAFGIVVGLDEVACSRLPEASDYERISAALAATRPTAVNLFWALRRMGDTYAAHTSSAWPVQRATLLSTAQAIHEEDIAQNRAIGRFGQELLEDGMGVITHCNAGALATGGYGTALGVIRAAHEAGKRLHVYVDETRPLLQGARLTAFELQSEGIPCTLICDNMAAALMRSGKVQAAVVGSDRTTAKGDVCNKIGSYGLAVAAKYHGIPFYAALPSSTFDLSMDDGSEIPIEERHANEVRGYGATLWAAEVPVWNPAFDVVPRELVSAIITEKGVFRPPYDLRG